MFESLTNAKMELRKPPPIGSIAPGSDPAFDEPVVFVGALARIDTRSFGAVAAKLADMVVDLGTAPTSHVFVTKVRRLDFTRLSNEEMFSAGQGFRQTHERTRGTWVALSPTKRFEIVAIVYHSDLEYGVVHLVEKS